METQNQDAYCLLDDDGILIERVCTYCNTLYPRSKFYKLTTGTGGHTSACKRCLAKKAAKSKKTKNKRGRARERLIPEVSLRAHNEGMLSKRSSGEFRLMNVKTRNVCPGIIIHEAHPGEHIVVLRKRIQGESQLLLLEMSMDGDTLQEMLLHNHWKMMERVGDVDEMLSQDITHLENLRRLPFSSESLKAMIQSHTYHLWMAHPRPLTPDEISEVYDIEKSSLDFIFNRYPLQLSPPGGDIQEN